MSSLLIALCVACVSAARTGARAPSGTATPTPRGPHINLGDATSDSLWPLPRYNGNVANATWSQVSQMNEAATNADCPFTSHGPGGTLEACQNGCNSAGGGVCTDINFNAIIGDCVYRRCVDPLHPNVSAAAGYVVWAITRPIITYAGINAASFAITATGFTDDILTAAFARARGSAFSFGAGSPSSLPAQVSSISVNVLTDDDTLRLGVDESYTLSITVDGASPPFAEITAPTVFGALHALESFAQLVVYNLTEDSYSVASADIRDAPRFPFRGVMIDTSRHFISVSVIKRVVDMMAAVKLNTLSVHLTDDQSFPLVVPSWPSLSLQGAYSNFSHVYTPAMITDLVAYARLRGIRILPEFDTPSHFSVLFGSYPQFAAVTKDGALCMIDPSREEVFSFLSDVWRDTSATFTADMLRIGGDEFQGCWNDCPTVMSWIASKWGANGTIYDAYHYFVRRLIDIVRSNGRETMAWLDVEGFPDTRTGETWAQNYSDVTLNVWTGCYSGDWQSDVSKFTGENGTVVVSGPFYITSNQPGAPHFSWQQMYATDLSNFTGNSTDAVARVKGGELCVWDDAAGTDSGDLAVSITPYIFGIAEALWSSQSVTSGQLPDEQRAHFHRCRLIQRGYASHPIFAFSTWCAHEFEFNALGKTEIK